MAHVFKEIFKLFKPPLAYGNPAPTVIFVMWMLWVAAPLSHVNPCVKFRCFAKSVGGGIGGQRLAAKASAGFGATAQEIPTKNGSSLPAFASAHPRRSLVRPVCQRYHGKPPVFFTNHVQGHKLTPYNTIGATCSAVKVPHV